MLLGSKINFAEYLACQLEKPLRNIFGLDVASHNSSKSIQCSYRSVGGHWLNREQGFVSPHHDSHKLLILT